MATTRTTETSGPTLDELATIHPAYGLVRRDAHTGTWHARRTLPAPFPLVLSARSAPELAALLRDPPALRL
jgi:hypothetical protein